VQGVWTSCALQGENKENGAIRGEMIRDYGNCAEVGNGTQAAAMNGTGVECNSEWKIRFGVLRLEFLFSPQIMGHLHRAVSWVY